MTRDTSHRRRPPRLTDTYVTSAHGAGGRASAALLDHVFGAAYGHLGLDRDSDSAILELHFDRLGTTKLDAGEANGGRVALTTDGYVVDPPRFPGGSIGRLAVCGTVNDLAVVGARPRWLSIGWVLEEGLAIDDLRRHARDVATAAEEAGIQIVTGDTKVVERSRPERASAILITTAGIGTIPETRNLAATSVRAGDAVLLSGSMGDHGVAVMLARGDLSLDADVVSDCAPVNGVVESLLAAVPDARWLRDPTRGGVATVCCELAALVGAGIRLVERTLPVAPPVRAACELLGIDPLYVANEGKVVAVVPEGRAALALETLRAHPLGGDAAIVGHVTDDHPGDVVLETAFGGTRVVDMLTGDPLPRIC